MFEHSDTIANLACSILKYFEVPDVPNATLPQADALLDTKPTNVVVLLLDAMGYDNMQQLLSPDGFFARHVRHVYSSVYPPTTVAATTSLDSGLFPSQHAWLGWSMYYPQLQKNVMVYTNKDDAGQEAADYEVAPTLVPYVSVVDRVQAAGHAAYRVQPFGEEPVTSIRGLCDRVESLCNMPGRKYIYAYWTQPDKAMHDSGADSEKVRTVLRDVEKAVADFSSRLHDTLLLITADHGHINARGTVITDYPDIMDCLIRLPSIEPRTLNLFVTPGREDDFRQAFDRDFGQDYRLYTRDEVLNNGLFGPGPHHPLLQETVGDFVAVALTERTVFNTQGQLLALKGVHAGGTDKERRIPLIAVRK